MKRAEIETILKKSGFWHFIRCESPKLDVWVRNKDIRQVEEQPIMLGEATDGHCDVWLSLGTTMSPEHEQRLIERLKAHLITLQ